MCEPCGCVTFIEQGREAILKRAVAIIREMGITEENAQLFEDGERICYLISSKVLPSEDEEVRQIAEWVAGLHQRVHADRSRAYAKAARDVFADFPAKAPPQQVITTWHQLEQLCRELDDGLLSSLEDPAIRDAIRAVQHVHDDTQQRRLELLQRYDLKDS
ncbi:MAG: hypothetical protein HY694_05320 [Deltaproteobacteria bacterium]|nr:hypothetical protein [Deltaproteobacteria bacterium]